LESSLLPIKNYQNYGRQRSSALSSNDAALISPLGLAIATNPLWELATHQIYLDEKLRDVAAGRIKRLLVTMPPRHGKSELISKYFPAWYVATFPEKRVILASYEADFAASWGRKSRDILDEYGKQIYNVQVKSDSSAAKRWDIYRHNGGMNTAGVGGPITGKGADVLIIDDPIKNSEDANSFLKRDKIWEWYLSTAFTRLEPKGAVILVMTRWHEDDLAGRLLLQERDKWEVIAFPAFAEDEDDVLGRDEGAALWPERYDIPQLNDIKETVSAYYWAAMYQQRPAPREGGIFKRKWFLDNTVNVAPANSLYVRYWDLAATAKTDINDPDYTAGALVALHEGMYYVVDVVRLRDTPQKVEQLIRRTAETDYENPMIYIEQEPGASGVQVIDYYRRTVLPDFPMRAHKPTGAKESRILILATHAEIGNLKIKRAEWNKYLIDEAEVFPQGAHDDILDAISGAVAMLQQKSPRKVRWI
jgi:predicted phage terminase large subunit-like protein